MTFPYEEWDFALSERLEPIRREISGVTVAGLPQEAGKFSELEYEFMDFFFSQYQGLAKDVKSKSQKVTMTLMLRLLFDKRYSEDININKKVLEWVEVSALGLLLGYRLPKSATELVIENGKLFPPESGRWYKEITFSFETWVQPHEIPEIIPPKVTQIITKGFICKKDIGVLAEVKKNGS